MNRLKISKREIEYIKSVHGRSKNEEKVNYFEMIKTEHGKKTIHQIKDLKRDEVYFDTETFEFFREKDNPDELPTIVPYLIGVCTSKPGSYNHFLGLNSTQQFLKHLFALPESKGGYLIAYNLDYDFHVIRPWIVDNCLHWLEIYYQMTENKRFIFGGLKNKYRKLDSSIPELDIKFIDLWNFQKTLIGSLDDYMKHILKLTYDKHGNVFDDDIALELHKSLQNWGFTPSSFKKLEQDKVKVNLHEINGEYFYWTSKQDGVDNKPPKKLDLEGELKYLKNDVTSMVTINLEQKLMRNMALKLLSIEDPISVDRSITAPGFTKYLFEEYTKKFMVEGYRRGFELCEYQQMFYSYTGAFVGGNKDILYLDEQKFKELYPGKSFYDKDGNPIIKSYDVNSMYPGAMTQGLPFGDIEDEPLEEWGDEYVEGCQVHFESELNPHISELDKNNKHRKLYDWKKEFSFLNNSFFGEGFRLTAIPGSHKRDKVFILRPLYDLFLSMCDANCRIVRSRYQRTSKEIVPFVETLYKIKQNKDNRYPKSTVQLVKLLLNSLYGKFSEKFKQEKIVWASDFTAFIRRHPELQDALKEYKVEVIDDKVVKRPKFKLAISPYLSLEKQCGFFIVDNKNKRFDRFGEEMREAITAGIFITSISRGKLLSTIKNEVEQGNVILYLDTDSIKMIEFNSPKFETHKDRLGSGKNEGSFHYFFHPNKLKKYVMHNILEKDEKRRWMVKTSGVPTRFLRDKNGEFNLDLLKVLYDPNNRVLIRNCKPVNKRNELFQTIIRRVDFKFVFENIKDPVTHILDGGILTRV